MNEPLPPPKRPFLEELRERVRHSKWTGDYEELRDFVYDLYVQAKVPIKDAELDPYEEQAP